MKIGDRIRFNWRGESLVGEITAIGFANYLVRVTGVKDGRLRVLSFPVRFNEGTLEVTS